MPINYADYPDDWPAISLAIREAANWCCEWCGAPNGQPHPVTGSKVVLTVAHHPDPDPMNCSEGNLHALCQACHLGLDRPIHLLHAAETRRRRKIEAGQLEFDL